MFSSKFGLLLNRNISINTIKSQCLKKSCYSTDAPAAPEKKERYFIHPDDQTIDSEGFRVFDPYMKKPGKGSVFNRTIRAKRIKITKDAFGRANFMPLDQDWTDAWPTKSMFKQSAVPLPVRQGFVKNLAENDGLPPEKYANCELIKIPNFLHLTPPHIKKHVAAIKKFCTDWPKELDLETQKDLFPIEITTSTYIYDGPSIRDDRARKVTLQIPLSSLKFKEVRSKIKLIKLAQHRYNPLRKMLTISTDRLPYRRQNEDYAMYLLTTLYYESKQFEEWEREAQEEDNIEYTWMKKKLGELAESNIRLVEQSDVYQQERIKVLSNETTENISSYKETVMKMLNLK